MIKTIDSDTRARFRYWRTRTFYSIFVGYVFYYFTRKSYTFAMPLLGSELGFHKSQLGILVTVFSITYGVSKFVCGILGDKSNPRYFMSSGLILTGIFNLCFGFSSSLWLFILFWGLNGWFQGFGWPPCAHLLTYWYSFKSRGTWWSIWSTSHNIGGAVIPIVVAICVQYAGWRYALYVPGVMCIICGFLIFERLRDTPESLGLPSADAFEGMDKEFNYDQDEPLSAKQLLLDYVLFNRYIWYLALANFCVYIVRTGINDWSVLYLSEARGFSLIQAGACIPWFEIGGVVGMLIAGFLSDRITSDGRGFISAIFMLFLTIPLLAFWFISGGGYIVCSLLMFVVGLFLFGPQMLIGCAAVEKTDKRAAGTASGFAGIFGYIGAAVAGYPFGVLIDLYGWDSFFIVLLLASVIGAICFLPLLYNTRGYLLRIFVST
jgi:MFS transporter, OPA family, sugar phosphate sensor protein UhpC